MTKEPNLFDKILHGEKNYFVSNFTDGEIDIIKTLSIYLIVVTIVSYVIGWYVGKNFS